MPVDNDEIQISDCNPDVFHDPNDRSRSLGTIESPSQALVHLLFRRINESIKLVSDSIKGKLAANQPQVGFSTLNLCFL